MKRFIVAALTLPVFLVGCGADVESTSPHENGDSSRQNLDSIEGVIERDGNTDFVVRKFTLDGTTCIMTNMSGTALSCDWDNDGTR